MIGDNKYIAHFMAKKEDSPNKDEHQIEVMLNELFRHLKKEMMYANENSLKVPYLGTFVTKNRKLRNFVRKCIKVERGYRAKENEGKIISDLDKVFRERNFKQLQSTLKQINSIRHMFIQRKEMYNKKRLSKLVDNNSTK